MSRASDIFTLPGTGNLPAKSHGGGYVYAVEFTDRMVKVGMTCTPQRRVELHVRNGAAFGVTALRAWVSPRHRNYRAVERLLIRLAESMSEGNRNAEYFIGCPFDKLVKAVRRFDFDFLDEASDTRYQSDGRWLLDLLDHVCAKELERSARDIPSHVGRIFGRIGDVHDFPEFKEEPVPFALVQSIADLTGRTVESVLRMSAIDMIAETVLQTVRAEASRLRIYAIENGRTDLIRPMTCDDIPEDDGDIAPVISIERKAS